MSKSIRALVLVLALINANCLATGKSNKLPEFIWAHKHELKSVDGRSRGTSNRPTEKNFFLEAEHHSSISAVHVLMTNYSACYKRPVHKKNPLQARHIHLLARECSAIDCASSQMATHDFFATAAHSSIFLDNCTLDAEKLLFHAHEGIISAREVTVTSPKKLSIEPHCRVRFSPNSLIDLRGSDFTKFDGQVTFENNTYACNVLLDGARFKHNIPSLPESYTLKQEGCYFIAIKK